MKVVLARVFPYKKALFLPARKHFKKAVFEASKITAERKFTFEKWKKRRKHLTLNHMEILKGEWMGRVITGLNL